MLAPSHMLDPRRISLPVKGPGPYRVELGRIVTEACEINAVDHCDLSCRGCSHLSPASRHRKVDPDSVYRDLAMLAAVYRADHVRLLGGEPLLHPRLTAVIDAVRASRVTSRVRLLTNGRRLDRMNDDFWRAIDEVHVAEYPGCEIDPAVRHGLVERAAEAGVDLVFKRFDHFREPFSLRPAQDRALVDRIYRTCQIAHVWRCHTVADGALYRCPQSLFLGRAIAVGRQGIVIDEEPDFGERLLAFLERPEPLAACQSCLGSAGARYAHQQVRRDTFFKLQDRDHASMLDLAYLTELEAQPGSHNSCWRLDL
jgi:organic radical activating enzyme